jgi:hypothetical protein
MVQNPSLFLYKNEHRLHFVLPGDNVLMKREPPMTSFSDKAALIKAACLKMDSKDPIAVAVALMHLPSISMHGPEHHLLDGAAFLTAYKNAGGAVDLPQALDELEKRAAMMPGATCGYWGVCGSAASLGAALSVLHGTGPLSNNEAYKDNMRLTSAALAKIGEIGGPRCCKRNAYLSIITATEFVKEHYGVTMNIAPFHCEFSPVNPTCLKTQCPFYPGK